MLHQDMDSSQIKGKQVLEYLQIIIDSFKSTHSTDYTENSFSIISISVQII